MASTISFSEMDQIKRHHIVRVGPWRKSQTVPGFEWPLATRRPGPNGTINPNFIWYMPYSQGSGYSDLYAYASSQNLINNVFPGSQVPTYQKFYSDYPSISNDAHCLLLMEEVATQAGLFPGGRENYLTKFVRTHPMSSIAMYNQHVSVSGGVKYRWVVVFIDYDYYSSKRLLYSIGTEADFKDMIRYIRYAKLCGINLRYLPDTQDFLINNVATKNIQYVAETIRRSAVAYFANEIQSLLNLTKFGDVPSLNDHIDDILNNKLMDFDLELRESDFSTIIDQSYVLNRGYTLPAKHLDNFLDNDTDFSYLDQVSLDDVWMAGWAGGSSSGKGGKIPIVALTERIGTGLRIREEYKRFRQPLPISNEMIQAIEKETQRIKEIVIANAEKATAALIAYEEGTAQDHKDVVDPSENPFLIYSREDSEQVKAPLFRDISIRPGKPTGGLIKNTRIPFSAYKEVPKRLRDIIRAPDEEGRNVPIGGEEKEGGNMLLTLAAIGAGGYLLYRQAGG